MGLDQDEQLRSVAVLGDPVRKKLYDLLRSSDGSLSRDECAEALELPRSTLRTQLDKLVDEGLLRVEFRKVGHRTGPGSGRPTKLYAVARAEVSASVPPRHYDLAATLLAAAVQRTIDTGEDIQVALSTIAFSEGRRAGLESGDIHSLLHQRGYSPEADGEGGTIMANCPFHKLSRDHTGIVCSLNEAFLGGALNGCADNEHELAPDENISHCCARLSPKL